MADFLFLIWAIAMFTAVLLGVVKQDFGLFLFISILASGGCLGAGIGWYGGEEKYGPKDP